MKIDFIVNSKSRKVQGLISEIRNHSHPLLENAGIHMTEYEGHARDLARTLTETGSSDVLVAAGGDGTLHEVVNGVMISASESERKPVMGLIPMGSANDFARIQKISRNLDSLVQAIQYGKFEKIDIGRIKIKSEPHFHYFINVADSGIGAEVVQRMESHSIFRKILSPDIKFASAILRTFFTYKRKDVEILIDNESLINGKILTLVIANSSSFASGLIIAPDARINDNKFQILVGDISLWGYLMSIVKLKKGKKLTIKGVRYLEARRVAITGPGELLTEADGELIGSGNVEVDCLPRVLDFIIPETGSK